MTWNTKLFAFAFFAFAVYIFAVGDQGKWKALFSQAQTAATVPQN